MLLASLVLLSLTVQPPACKDVEVCRAEALIAHAKKDFETFHDLAWAAFNKGKPNDPELMLLVARAQSLSGRPGDALVMLERIAALGAPTDALTSDDFVRVRAHPRWAEVEVRLAETGKTGQTEESGETGTGGTKKTEKEPPTVEPKPEPAKPEPTKSEPPKREPPKSTSPKRELPKAEPARPMPPKPEPAKSEPAEPVSAADKPVDKSREAGAPLKFTTLLSPSALAYDGVSKRFIIADREARRIAVIDEHTGQVSTLVGAQGALGEVGGIAIDARQGDLWVVSAGDAGATLHKIQLISGRSLAAVPLKGIDAAIVGLTFVRDNGLVATDADGNLWRIAASGKADKIAALEYVPRALASDPLGRIYLSAGGPRLARYSIVSGFRRLGGVNLDEGIPTDTPFVVTADRLHVIVRVNGEYELRSMRLSR